MREIVSSNPSLPFEIQSSNKTVLVYQKRYLKISELLEQNSKILKSFHKNIKSLSSDKGRNSIFSSDTLFRCLLVRILEGLSLRDTSIRLNNDLFLKSFAKIGMGDIPDFRLLHIVEKELSSKMSDEIIMLFFHFTNEKNLVTSENLRIDKQHQKQISITPVTLICYGMPSGFSQRIYSPISERTLALILSAGST